MSNLAQLKVFDSTGYPTLKAAAHAARDDSAQYTNWTKIVPIYEESDGTFSIHQATNGRSKFIIAVDKAGKLYDLVTTTDETVRTIIRYVQRQKKG